MWIINVVVEITDNDEYQDMMESEAIYWVWGHKNLGGMTKLLMCGRNR